MTVCRDVPAGLERNWQNLNEMYVAVGVRRAGDAGTALAPPSTYADSQTLSYMVGPSGAPRRSIDISIFNDVDARACFFRWAGYDETAINARVTAIRSEHADDQAAADAAVATYLATLPALQQQIYRVVGMISIFRLDYRREGGANVGGGNRANPDSPEAADPNIITDYEIQQYAAEALEGGDENPEYVATGGRILSGIHAMIGLMHYVTTPAPAEDGPRVVATEPVDAGPAVVPTVNPNPASSRSWVSEHLTELIVGGLTAVGLGSLATYLVMRNRGASTAEPRPNTSVTVNTSVDRAGETRTERASTPPPSSGNSPRVVADTTGKPPASGGDTGPRVVADTTGAPSGGGTPSRGTPTVAVPDDIASALAGIDGNASPAGGARPSGTPSIDGVTPENVIISGTTAEPVAGVTPAVVRAQIVLHYRHFLSQAAREALAAGRPLPADGELVASAFSREVNELTDRVIAEYHRMSTADADALRDMWTSQRDDGRPIVRRGVPQRLLMSVVGDYITAEAARAGSPFEGGFGTEVRREAERRSGETDYFERGMREVLRDPVRLGR
ncbi:MAG TPA: hypothetical protein VLJ37_09665 [bacterium]|nr:hypothetical protein [bacterium]